MSYEGYVQNICANGHYYEKDAYASEDKCPDCSAEVAWSNGVDDTNCDSVGIIPLGILIREFRISKAKFQACSLGHSHQIRPDIFRVPTQDETWKFRHYRDRHNTLRLLDTSDSNEEKYDGEHQA